MLTIAGLFWGPGRRPSLLRYLVNELPPLLERIESEVARPATVGGEEWSQPAPQLEDLAAFPSGANGLDSLGILLTYLTVASLTGMG